MRSTDETQLAFNKTENIAIVDENKISYKLIINMESIGINKCHSMASAAINSSLMVALTDH